MSALALVLLSAIPPPEIVVRFEAGPYRPGMDRELTDQGLTPYADVFGDGPGLLLQPSIGVLFGQPLGTFGLELTGGWFRVSERALVDDGETPSRSGKRSGGKTALRVAPLSVTAVCRFDILSKAIGIPILPYVQGGLAYGLWQISRGDGRSVASGGTAGFRLSAGLAVDLAQIDPKASLALEQQFGIKGTELTLAIDHLALSGLGADRALMLGDTTWRGGVGLRF